MAVVTSFYAWDPWAGVASADVAQFLMENSVRTSIQPELGRRCKTRIFNVLCFVWMCFHAVSTPF